MPTYDYVCEANGRRVEVNHKMSEEIRSWGALCELAQIEPGDTPREAAVRKLISGGAIIGSSASSNPEPSCGTGGCAGGFCGLS